MQISSSATICACQLSWLEKGKIAEKSSIGSLTRTKVSDTVWRLIPMRNINKSKFMRRFMHKLVGDATPPLFRFKRIKTLSAHPY